MPPANHPELSEALRLLLLFRPDMVEKVSWLKSRFDAIMSKGTITPAEQLNEEAFQLLENACNEASNLQVYPYSHILEVAKEHQLSGIPLCYRFPQMFRNDLGPRQGFPATDTPTLFSVTVWVWPLRARAIYECCGVVQVVDISKIYLIRDLLKYPKL